MNPPSALHGAMSRERKPFTYTPGGLNLSEIKSERMAARLMRNAMNPGVPETPVHQVQSPPASLNPSVLPNFNCLPVQVFPTFQLPANPKSLLRTRSNPDPREHPRLRQNVDDKNSYECNNVNKPSLMNINYHSPVRPSSMYDNFIKSNPPLELPTNYGSNGKTDILLTEKRYDAEIIQPEKRKDIEIIQPEKRYDAEIIQPEKRYDAEIIQPTYLNRDMNSYLENKTIVPADIYKPSVELNQSPSNSETSTKSATNVLIDPVVISTTPFEEIPTSDNEQTQVKIVKKQSTTEVEKNGDTEAAVVVKLPSKKSASKTETNVEVVKKILPDGTIEEVKTTTTKTTVDGKTETTIKTETRTLPKEVEENEEEYETVEEDEIEQIQEEESTKKITGDIEETSKLENGQENEDDVGENPVEVTKKENGQIKTEEEHSETSTTKKVVIVQSTEHESEEEIEEEVEEVEDEEEEQEDEGVDVEQVIILKTPDTQNDKTEVEQEKECEEEEEHRESERLKEDESINKEINEEIHDDPENEEEYKENDIEVEEEKDLKLKENEKEEEDTVEEIKQSNEDLQNDETPDVEKQVKEQSEEEVEEEYEEAEDTEINEDLKETEKQDEQDNVVEKPTENIIKIEIVNGSEEDKSVEQPDTITNDENDKKEQLIEQKELKQESIPKLNVCPETKVSFREPSIPLEKVEDVEIKPIGPAQEIIKKCHTEIITTTTDKPVGALSTQTEYNRIENIVTVNRTTKTLDHAYEELPSNALPTGKTYFAPNTDRILSTPQPSSRPYQPVYPSEPQQERRHSLLLERLSMERQMPTADIYQNNSQYTNQGYDDRQWSQEPQSEVLTVSNVKPSTITKNQQWYQQTKTENEVYSNVASSPQLNYTYSQKPVTPTPQTNYTYPQAPVTPTPQLGQTYTQTQPQFQPHIQCQFVQPEFKPPYAENASQTTFKSNSENYQQNVYQNYTPKPSWVNSTFEPKSSPVISTNQYSSVQNESRDNYQNTRQFSSSYVPPPWEQDPSYVTESQNYFQPPPPSTTLAPSSNQSWKPKTPSNKFSKPVPTSYIPPAPNQSFVKPVTASDPSSKQSGRKTYYSEYERRYISVPEATYIPTETKFSVQPDPSPQYYYDNNEPVEIVEPQWRKELREFTEKSQTTTYTENTSVRPPWEESPKYVSSTEYTATASPTWSQTLRPRSWRERSYEPENVASKEWSKTNTLGRGRPQNSFLRNNMDTTHQRTRGVSVDRYNPNSYQSPVPSEHAPVQSQTLNPSIHPKTYHNPSGPGYHSRASAEPREQQVSYPQPRARNVSQAPPPVQSRSFKYLQWITGTED